MTERHCAGATWTLGVATFEEMGLQVTVENKK